MTTRTTTRTTWGRLLRAGRWKRRRRGHRPAGRRPVLGRAASSPLRLTSFALPPFVVVMAASAARLRPEAAPAPEPAAPRPTAAAPTRGELALQGYRAFRVRVARGYARRFAIPEELADLIHEAAVEEGVDPELAFRLVRVESSFRPWAVGPAGAVGLAQVLPSTARWLDPTVTRERLFEAGTNLRLGFRYLRMLLDRYGEDTRLALLAYNRGPGTVAALLAMGQDPANGYAARVLGTVAAERPRAPEGAPERGGPAAEG